MVDFIIVLLWLGIPLGLALWAIGWLLYWAGIIIVSQVQYQRLGADGYYRWLDVAFPLRPPTAD